MMALEWIRFCLTAVLLIIALGSFAASVIGVYRFGFVLNRIHAAGIGDTFALSCILLSLIVSSGTNMDSLKLFLIALFMWFTSPVSTHFLGQVEYFTNPDLYRYVDRCPQSSGKEAGDDADES